MKRRLNKNLMIIACMLGLVLGPVAGGLAAVDTGASAEIAPVVTGSQLVQDKINFLMATLQQRLDALPETDRPALFVGDAFSHASGLEQLRQDILNPDHPLYDAVHKAGYLHQSAQLRPALADDARLHLNLAILDSLDELLKNPSITDEIQNTVFALIDLLKELELPEAYQVPDTRFGFTGLGRPDDRDRIDREGFGSGFAGASGFNYYGKPFDLDANVFVDERGFIVFSEDPVDTGSIVLGGLNLGNNMPAVLGPFVGLPMIPIITVSGGDVEKTDLRYTYKWEVNGFGQPVMDTSASLYKNDWIVFNYESNPDAPYFFDILPGLAGLSPGDGSAGSGHPGEGQPRDWISEAGFFSRTLGGGSPATVAGDDYTAFYNFGGGDGSFNYGPAVIGDTFFLFRPYKWVETENGFEYAGTPNTYMISAGTRNILAGGLSSLDEAIDYVGDDLELLRSVDRGENDYNRSGGVFVPGRMRNVPADGGLGKNSDGPGTGAYGINWSGYEYGLQTVGQDANGDAVFFDTPHPLVGPGLDRINDDGFLAYAVQVEEDIVNRKILEVHRERLNAMNRHDVANSINTARGYANIRVRDDWLTRKSDAQSGRVLKDHNGNWVRVEQYVLRPDTNSVQILSASLRDVDGKAQLSTLDFTTTFLNGGYGLDKDLRDLPWNSWLNTQLETVGDVNFKYVETRQGTPLLDKMSVTIKNPSGQHFQETRSFDVNATVIETLCTLSPELRQYITHETLDVSGVGAFENNYYFNSGVPASADVEFFTLGRSGGFSYHFTDVTNPPIHVALYELSGNHFEKSAENDYDDIWDALRVNEDKHMDIGGNSLEIVITDGAESPRFNEFDVVYVPMSRMLWKDKAVNQQSDSPYPEA